MERTAHTSNITIPEARLRRGWPIIWLISSFTWMVVLLLLLVIPTDPKNRLFLGFSAGRVLLIGIAILLIGLNLAIAWQSRRSAGWRARILDPWVKRTALFRISVFSLAAAAVGLWTVLFLSGNSTHPNHLIQRYSAIYERILPFFIGFFLQCLVLAIGILILRVGIHTQSVRENRGLWWLTLVITGAFLAIWGAMEMTGIGLTPDVVGWGMPGVPVLFYQVLLAWLIGLGCFIIFLLPTRGINRWQGLLIDLVVCLVLWAAAVTVWSDQHVQRSYFAPSPTPPNEEIYPYSDAGFYDYTAQSVLLGYGFLNGKVVPRPLYILMLAGFHAIAGQSYKPTIYIQTLVLAILPVFLYLLGKTFHSRGLGISLGILAIAREVNSIVATPWVEVSHSKLFLADLPTTIVIIALTWLTVRWLMNARQRWADAILVGGVLGISVLFRTQSILLLPAILFGAAWYYWKQWKRLVLVCGLVVLGLALVVSPWLIRNWSKTGSLVFDDPTTQSAMVAQRYSVEMGTQSPRQPDETEADYSARLSRSIRQFVFAHPGVVIRFVTAHSLNNFVSTVLVLPSYFSIDQRCNTSEVCSPFWIELTKDLSPMNGAMIFLNLMVVAFGIASSWRRWKLAGIMPILFLLVYSLSNGLARNSARRYILPVDWVSYLYLLVGLFEIAFWVTILFGVSFNKIQKGLTQPEPVKTGKRLNSPGIELGLASVIFLLIGFSLPAAEMFRPAQFQIESKLQLFNEAIASLSPNQLVLSGQEIQAFSNQDQAVIMKGRIFYPRFYPPLGGEPGGGWPAYKPYEYRPTGKIGFILIGPQGATQMNLALDHSPEYFPNAADAIIIGCQENGYIDALLVQFIDGSGRTVYRSKLDNLACPLK